MALRIYSTLSRQKEDFQTIEPGKVTMYVCGPTVYDKAHVGHAMSALVFDIIRRYLEYRGYKVQHAMNYTDVDDKIINKANQIGIDPIKLAEKYIDEFGKHLVDLNILPATVYPRATHEIPISSNWSPNWGKRDMHTRWMGMSISGLARIRITGNSLRASWKTCKQVHG